MCEETTQPAPERPPLTLRVQIRWWALRAWFRRCEECSLRGRSEYGPRWEDDKVAQMLGIAHLGCPACGKGAIAERNGPRVDVYAVGVLDALQRRELRRHWRYLRYQIARRNWRAVRNSFNGYLAEHDNHPHNCGKGWTKRAAMRRAERLCARAAS